MAKVVVVQELHKKGGLEQKTTNNVSHRARLFAQNFDACLAGIVI